MKRILAVYLLFFTFQSFAQVLYNPTWVYDGAGGLFDADDIKSLSLDFYDSDYHDTLTNRWFGDNKSRLAASLDYKSTHFDSVGVRYKGNSTFYYADQFGSPKVPYNIDINEYVSGQKLLGYKKVKLGNVLFDPSFLKELIASEFYNKYLPSHQTTLMELSVGGTYIGLYNNTESIDKQFLKKHFGEKSGAFYKCEPAARFGSGDPFYSADLVYRGSNPSAYNLRYEPKYGSSWTSLIELMNTLNNDPSKIEDILNIDRVLWYFAVNMVVLNEDAYNTMYLHNYYFYQLGDGRFQIIPWDLSESFAGALLGRGSANSHYHRSPEYGYNPRRNSRPLVFQLLSNPDYKKVYYAHIKTILDDVSDTTALRNRIDFIQNLGRNSVVTDPNKYFSNADYYSNVDNVIRGSGGLEAAAIMETLRHRIPYLNTIVNQINPPLISNLSQSLRLPKASENVYISAKVTGTTEVQLMTSISKYKSGFMPTEMLDDGLNGDLAAGDSIYTALVPFQNAANHVKYYVKASNADAVKLEPERAEYFYYHYIVDGSVAIESEWDEMDISLYPNPASDYLKIDYPDSERYFVVNILDINGKIIINKKLNNNKNIIYLNKLINGIYFVKIYNKKYRMMRKLIVVR